MHSHGQRVIFAAPRRPWRWISVVLLGVCSILTGIGYVFSRTPDTDLWFVLVVVLPPLWFVALFGTLFACYSWLLQFSLGGSGSVAWMDPEGIHQKNGQSISWPEVESVFTRQATTGDLLLCIKPTAIVEFIARAPRERQDVMRSNVDKYEVPVYINLSAFWQGSTDDLSTKITVFTADRLSLLQPRP